MDTLIPAVLRLAQLQRQSIDKPALEMSLAGINTTVLRVGQCLNTLRKQMQWTSLQRLQSSDLDPSYLPCLAISKQEECFVLKSFNAQSEWVMEGA
ncbi:MAG: hypothetical protein ACOVKF_06155, partial [Limnohabitans sp.]